MKTWTLPWNGTFIYVKNSYPAVFLNILFEIVLAFYKRLIYLTTEESWQFVNYLYKTNVGW